MTDRELGKIIGKFYLPNLRPTLKRNGRKFSDFMDEAKTPSRRTWALGTNKLHGVTETTANSMRIQTDTVLEKWGINSNDASIIKNITEN